MFYLIGNKQINQEEMNSIELYGYGESVASNMARVALSEKKIAYKYNIIYLESKGQHLTKEYRNLNPKNLVPTMCSPIVFFR